MKKASYVLGLLRIFLGIIFLWAFFDKLIGLGFATPYDKGWLEGNSPTYGFLMNSTKGPFALFFQNIAGNIFVDGLFMMGLLLIGISLILGIFMNIAGVTGSLMMFLMWLAVLPPKNNPFLDEHIIYILLLILLIIENAGNYFGFGKYWKRIVKSRLLW